MKGFMNFHFHEISIQNEQEILKLDEALIF